MQNFSENKDDFKMYAKNFFNFSKEILSQGHIKMIIENKFWHDYYFHYRDLADGSITQDKLVIKLSQSLKKYGL